MSLRFVLDAHGRLISQDDPTRTALAERAGTFVLLPTVPDLIVARRTPGAGGDAPQPRCVLAGDLGGLAIAEFVGFIHQSRLSGLLVVASGDIERTLVFKDGDVRGARSTASGERIGEVALRLGYVQPAQLDALAGAGRPIGKLLVDGGMLTASDLWKCIHEQVATVFHSVLLAREGVFALLSEAHLDLATPLALNTQALLMDGIRRLDEMALFRARIPGPDVFVRRRPGRATAALDAREQEALALAEEPRRVGEIARRLRISEFDATKLLYHLLEAGHLEVVEAPPASPQVEASRAATLVAGINDVLRTVNAKIIAAGQRDAFVAAVRSFLGDAVNRHAPLWADVVPAPDGSVEASVLLRNVERLDPAQAAARGAAPDRTRALHDALRELMFFYLFQVGELLPRAADEQLGVEVKRRLEALGTFR